MESAEKQFLAGYLCASLYYLVEDTHSRRIVFSDSKASKDITKALLAAASSNAVLVRFWHVVLFCGPDLLTHIQ